MGQAAFRSRYVGRYAVDEEIGSGGLGSVHLARLIGPAGFSRTVAVKRSHAHLAANAGFALAVLDEARLASRIHHANVVSTLDVVHCATEVVVVMEYVHGESVSTLVHAAQQRGERVPLAIAVTIVTDTLHGLHASHEARNSRGEPLGIVHRDVSPQNILVGVDGIVRLVDFGIAKAADRLQGTTDVANSFSPKGKYPYMAPEQVRGEATTRRTDLFAAGVVFWELLTGERLFLGKNAADSMQKVLRTEVPRASGCAPGLPLELDSILARALTRDPTERYPTAREMALAIEACVPRAAPSEVGLWVEHLVGDRLRARADAIAKLESEPEFQAATMGSPISHPSWSDLPHTEPIPPARVRTSRETDGPASEPPTWRAPMLPPPEARGPRTRAAVLIATLGALFGAGGASAAWAHRSPPAVLGPDPLPAVAMLPRAEIAAPEPRAESPIGEPVGTTPASHPTAPRTALGAEGRVVTRSSTVPNRSAPKRARGCDPPYSLDSEGREVFKPECL